MPNTITFPGMNDLPDMLDIIQGLPLLHLAAGECDAAVNEVWAWVYPGKVNSLPTTPPASAVMGVIDSAGSAPNWKVEFVPAPRQSVRQFGALNTLVVWYRKPNGAFDREKRRVRCVNPPTPE